MYDEQDSTHTNHGLCFHKMMGWEKLVAVYEKLLLQAMEFGRGRAGAVTMAFFTMTMNCTVHVDGTVDDLIRQMCMACCFDFV